MRFTILRIPIEIRWSFWLVALLIFPFQLRVLTRPENWGFVAAWLVVVAVSVIAHELGHALLARRFGAEVDMTLYALGGFTRWATTSPLSAWRRVGVAAAGSTVGFVLGGLVWFGLDNDLVPDEAVLLGFALESFWQVNLLWGVLNWLPIRPLDGGHIFQGALEAMFGRAGTRIADVVFPVVTLVGGVWAFTNGFFIAGVFAFLLMMDEVRRWTARRPTPPAPPPSPGAAPDPDDEPFTLFDD